MAERTLCMWGWGYQTKPPTVVPSLRGNRIYVEIRLLSAIVGLIDWEVGANGLDHTHDHSSAGDSVESMVPNIHAVCLQLLSWRDSWRLALLRVSTGPF